VDKGEIDNLWEGKKEDGAMKLYQLPPFNLFLLFNFEVVESFSAL